MGIGQSMRKLADRAKEKVRPEQAHKGVDQAADKFDKSTGGKYRSHADKGQEKANEAVDKYYEDER